MLITTTYAKQVMFPFQAAILLFAQGRVHIAYAIQIVGLIQSTGLCSRDPLPFDLSEQVHARGFMPCAAIVLPPQCSIHSGK